MPPPLRSESSRPSAGLVRALLQKPATALCALLTRRVRIVCDQIPYEFEKVPLRKLLNWICTEASLLVRPARPWGLPTHLMVEPTTHCNLSCALCPVTTGLGRPQGHMDIATFRKVVDEIGEYLFLILLWDWGEPFVNPAIYEMIAYAHARGIKLVSSSNGHPFAHGDHAERVVRSGLDTLIFAVDGVTQESYVRYRAGGQLDVALEGIRKVVACKRALGSATPLVNLRFIVMKHNEHEIPRLRELAVELGVDALTLKTMNPFAQDPYVGAGTATPSWQDFVPSDPRYRRFKVDAPEDRRRLRRNPCKNLWNHPSLHFSGVVSACTYDPRELYPLGDLRRQTFRELWHGAAYQRMRREFRRHAETIDMCRECSYAYAGGNCTNETIAAAEFFAPGKGP